MKNNSSIIIKFRLNKFEEFPYFAGERIYHFSSLDVCDGDIQIYKKAQGTIAIKYHDMLDNTISNFIVECSLEKDYIKNFYVSKEWVLENFNIKKMFNKKMGLGAV